MFLCSKEPTLLRLMENREQLKENKNFNKYYSTTVKSILSLRLWAIMLDYKGLDASRESLACYNRKTFPLPARWSKSGAGATASKGGAVRESRCIRTNFLKLRRRSICSLFSNLSVRSFFNLGDKRDCGGDVLANATCVRILAGNV